MESPVTLETTGESEKTIDNVASDEQTDLLSNFGDGRSFGLESSRRRVAYEKLFLIECFQHPVCSRKPADFPQLDCTLAQPRLSTSPFVQVPSRRKDETIKKDRESDDNISLRPHSGNFSSGCVPNHVSPGHNSQGLYNTRFQASVDEQQKNIYDRDIVSRNNFRGGLNNRIDDRARMDRGRDLRDRDRDLRDRDRIMNDRMGMDRDIRRGGNRRPVHGSEWNRPQDGENPDWNIRRRPNYGGPEQRRYSRDDYDYRRGRDDDNEPEWFSGGPSSQHETIELQGFVDDERRDRKKHNSSSVSRENSTQDMVGDDRADESNDNKDKHLEEFFKNDFMGVLPNGLLEEKEPSGSSRFSKLFQRNSTTPVPTVARKLDMDAGKASDTDRNSGITDLNTLFAGKAQENKVEEKSPFILNMESVLRGMLLNKPQEKPVPKPAPEQNDLNVLQKLLQQVVSGGKQKDELEEKSMKQTMSNNGEAPQQFNHPHGLHGNDMMRKGNDQTQHINMQQFGGHEHGGQRQPLNIQPSRPEAFEARAPQDPSKKVQIAPQQILNRMPQEAVNVLLNTEVSPDVIHRKEMSRLVQALACGEITLGDIIQQAAVPHAHMRQLAIAALKLILQGTIILPEIRIFPELPKPVFINPFPYPGPMMPPRHELPPNPMMWKPPMVDPRIVQEEYAQRNKEKKAAGTMSFTPTAVIRKMTGDPQARVIQSFQQKDLFPRAPIGPPQHGSPGDFMDLMKSLNVVPNSGSMAPPPMAASLNHPSHVPLQRFPMPQQFPPIPYVAHQYPQQQQMNQRIPGPITRFPEGMVINPQHIASNGSPDVGGPRMIAASNPKNKLSEDLSKLLSGFSDGVKPINLYPNASALSVEDVEKAQIVSRPQFSQ